MNKIILGSIIALLALALMIMPGLAADPALCPERTIQVSGTGEVYATPDISTVNVGVQTRNADVKVAQQPLGALAFERELRREPHQLTLVQRLPVPLARNAPAATMPSAQVSPGEWPTHVVHLGRAWPLGAAPLYVGWSVPAGQRALAVTAGPGVSRVHCSLVRDANGAWLEDQSTYGTLLNGERVGGRVALRAGDRLWLGNPGVELALVRVVDGDGAA